MSLLAFVCKQIRPWHALRAFCAERARRLRRRLENLNDPYRPEFHYMRGPGPKWRQKHARTSAGENDSPGTSRQ